ncbi:hypothetical protein ACLIBH_08550 [Virgibacillus sp. W0430]|uniref:hypothetical protein n=1 Tax=Virgibacillus sp. W0430 TaxID=3391580 RepID=UPI003F45A59D
MKNTIGIIGPADTVQLILEVANEFTERIQHIPFIYKSFEETKEIIQTNGNKVDVWIFSGQAPFAIAEKYLESQSGFYPHLNGSSLTKVLLDISYKDHKQLNRLSFDTIPSHDVLETFSELNLNTEGLKLYPYSGYKPTEELVQYHSALHESNQVDACITGIRSVYEALNARGVPAYRITPTKMAIRDTILMASQQSEIIQFKSAQISILILQIYDMNKRIGDSDRSFDMYRVSLKIQELMIEFTESIQGSFILQGNDKVIMYSTRGALEVNQSNDVFSLLDKITMLTKLTANIGIGYGNTVFGAEQNAYLALNHANDYGKNNIMLADERGIVEGPLHDAKSILFSRRSYDAAVINKLKLSGINVSTYNKVLSIQDNLKQGFISAFELAKWLGMTQRNARRILGDLEKHGLAEIVGEETPGARGRPRRLFKVGVTEEDSK